MLRILGRVSSINVQKVVWCCDELGLAYERVDIGGKFGGNDTPEYLAKNPTGLVPTIEEDGFVLPESNAIVRYLSARHSPGNLWPEDLRQRAQVEALAWHLVRAWGAPSWEAARAVAEEEVRHTSEVCETLAAESWITVRREPRAGGHEVEEQYSVYDRLLLGAHRL